MADKNDFGLIGYTLGVLSIVAGILFPNFGLIFGISGLVVSTKQKTDLSKKAKRLNIIGIIVSIIMGIASIAISSYLKINGLY